MTEVVAICSHSLNVENGVCAFRHDVSGASDGIEAWTGLNSRRRTNWCCFLRRKICVRDADVTWRSKVGIQFGNQNKI